MSYPDMMTISGEWIYFDKPYASEIKFQDLQIHTSNINRYNGAVHWSLLQHLTLCYLLAKHYNASPKEAIYCLAHDLHEIIVGDVVSGLKKYIPQFQALELAWETRVHYALGIPLQESPKEFVKLVDLKALCIEMHFLGHPGAEITRKKWFPEMTIQEVRSYKKLFEKAKNNPVDFEVEFNKFYNQGGK